MLRSQFFVSLRFLIFFSALVNVYLFNSILSTMQGNEDENVWLRGGMCKERPVRID